MNKKGETMPRRANPRPTRKAEGNIDLYSDWLKSIKNASTGRIVLVQTKTAKALLESLGIRNVIFYKEMDPNYELMDYLIKKQKEVILLLDTDRPSNALCEKLHAKMQQNGIKTNTRFRKVLFGCAQKDLGGLLKFLHEHVADTPRKHEGTKY